MRGWRRRTRGRWRRGRRCAARCRASASATRRVTPRARAGRCWAGCATARRARCWSTPRAPRPRSSRCSPSFARARRALGSPRSRVESVKVEGHEQFAIRGVSAGVFVVQEHAATAHHFDLRLEVDGVMRSWAVPKGPSMDPAVKRLAVEVERPRARPQRLRGTDRRRRRDRLGPRPLRAGRPRPWPEALERGHAVFVLHGEKLRGGFALQRTRPGEKPQWLLIKRRDEEAAARLRRRRRATRVGAQRQVARSAARRRSSRIAFA